MAIDRFTVGGTALVYVDPVNASVGSGNPYSLLGYTDKGVSIQIDQKYVEWFTDQLGPTVPVDFQDVGAIAKISVPLIACDDTVLSDILSYNDEKVTGFPTGAGIVGTPGLMVGQTGFYIGLNIVSDQDYPWYFPSTIIAPGFKHQVATVAHPFVLEFLAWPLVAFNANSAKGTILWSREA